MPPTKTNSQLHPLEDFIVVIDLERQAEIELDAGALGVHLALDDGRVGRIDHNERELDLEVAALPEALIGFGRALGLGGFGGRISPRG